MNAAVFEAALAALPGRFRAARPAVAVVLGSGWNGAVASVGVEAEVSYADLPGMGAATVLGHDGRLLLGRVPGTSAETLFFCGRRHWYEGSEWEAVTMPAVLAHRLGCRVFFPTNAAGGVSRALKPGDVAVISDHLRLSALSPLRGPHDPAFGPRFPDQSAVYDPRLRAVLREAGRRCGVPLSEGVYAFTGGPAYETPAEVRAYAALGADLVGMSTVPEATVASALGLRVAALSFVSNAAAGISETPLDGEDVVKCASDHAPLLSALVLEGVRALSAEVAAGEAPAP